MKTEEISKEAKKGDNEIERKKTRNTQRNLLFDIPPTRNSDCKYQNTVKSN